MEGFELFFQLQSRQYPFILKSDLFRKSLFFEGVDYTQFKQNEVYYENMQCPYCKTTLSKEPNQHMNCPHCKGKVFKKVNYFTDKTAFFTSEQKDIFYKVNENFYEWRAFLNEVKCCTDEEFEIIFNSKADRLENAIIEAKTHSAREAFINGHYGVYGSYCSVCARYYAMLEDYSKALYNVLITSYYQINAARNNGHFESRLESTKTTRQLLEERATVSTGIFDMIIEYSERLELNEQEVKKLFIEGAKANQVKGFKRTPELAWKKVYADLTEYKREKQTNH